MIINANNLILGRLASFAAKQALLGEKIEIVNSEETVIIGSKKVIYAKYDEKINTAIRNLEVRSRLTQKGLARIKDFSWEKTARETIKIYKEIWE